MAFNSRPFSEHRLLKGCATSLNESLVAQASACVAEEHRLKLADPKLPPFEGKPVRIRFMPQLTVARRQLYSKQQRGEPVHAGTFIRKRDIVLDSELRTQPEELSRILVHELFHFAWVRLSNQTRRSYEELIRTEFASKARGELGWSAEWRKRVLLSDSAGPMPEAKWREYLCESFCDTAAWLYAGIGNHQEFTLARRHRERRAKWFHAAYRESEIPI